MSTYNGELYLPEQLDSILRQTRLPDEMVVCDDASSDATVALLKQFALIAPFPVKVVENEQNLGSTRNFVKTCSLCGGDLIALSDQDDIWLPERLELSENLLRAQPEAGLVFSDAEVMDAAGRQLPMRLWAQCSFTPRVQQQLRTDDRTLPVRMRFVTGATVVFRAWLRDCFPVEPGWIHDEWLAAATALYADLLPAPDPMIRYRQHAAQQVGPSTRASMLQRLRQRGLMLADAKLAWTAHWQQLAQDAERTRTMCNRFAGQPLSPVGRARLVAYGTYADFQQGRARLAPQRLRRLLPVLRLRAEYARYYRFGGLGSMLRDLTFARSAT